METNKDSLPSARMILQLSNSALNVLIFLKLKIM